MENKNNLKISGSGSMSGGKYNEVSVSGSGKITGDIECNKLHISGSSKIEGNVKTREFKISGSCKVGGNLEFLEGRTSGSSYILGDVKGLKMSVSGGTKIDGKVCLDEVRVSGDIYIGKDCEVEKFQSSGGFKIEGLLNAENIEIEIGSKCYVNEIGGKSILIKKSEVFGISLMNLFGKKNLTADVIEGDDIDIEEVVAKVVRGKNVHIGSGCTIDRVEYSESFEISDNSKVKLNKKI
ncbi:polymer-forming cytoskeletal protein [Haloimpatiens sp. FM7315]|uniref:polymer-forming cytoskeletal protein n=1 Tax=Haloimpatiens sp. FM7315 TaxID=3298609 RepID=UPI0035A2F417